MVALGNHSRMCSHFKDRKEIEIEMSLLSTFVHLAVHDKAVHARHENAWKWTWIL